MTNRTVLTLLNAALVDLKVDGVAIGAAAGDEVDFLCRGVRAGECIDTSTIFYGASVTKQIVGVLLARAVVARVVDIDDSVRRWLPELPEWTGPVRLRHLVHHTSGLPDVTASTLDVPVNNVEVIERFHRLPSGRTARPGAGYVYNNSGYVLLAETLTRALRRPVEEIASTELFFPMGLTRTRLGGPVVQLPGSQDPPGTIGDGGLWTSIIDLTSWLQACNQPIFGAATQNLAETTGGLVDGSHVDYAWGVRVTPARSGRVITHGGSWQSWLAKTVRIPERRVAVAILSVGATEQAISDTGTQLAEALADW